MINETTKLYSELVESMGTGGAVSGNLKTNERIIARVTDGIYKEPWSAFRELISNAHDADATKVIIDTDYPFFNQIKVSDNGNGMDMAIIADLLTNIGGSAKRTQRGRKLGTVSDTNPKKSPGGRPLIGKIGIGLFAVAQLTQNFQIITTRKGSTERLSVTIHIDTYRDDDFSDVSAEVYKPGKFIAKVENNADIDSHGTTIVLMDIRPAVRHNLQSKDLWDVIEDQDGNDEVGQLEIINAPKFHIGCVDANNALVKAQKLPWGVNDSKPKERFQRLFQETVALGANSSDRNDLSHLDNYLKMIWLLALGSPIEYINGHPFDIANGKEYNLYALSNKHKGAATPFTLDEGANLRSAFKLDSGSELVTDTFEVYFDGVQLLRPIELPDKLLGSRELGKPFLFVGKVNTDFNTSDIARSGGKLAFEAYLYWNSKIVPKESIGALICINGASGSLFDSEFLGYQILQG